MNDIQKKFRESIWLGLLAAVLAGVLLHYCYISARRVLMPLFLLIGSQFTQFIESYPSFSYVVVVVLNSSFVIVAAALSSVVTLFILNYLLRPTAMLVSSMTMAVFLLLSNWRFLVNSSTVVKGEEPGIILIRLLAPVCAVGVFWFGSWWVVKRNTANHRFHGTASLTRRRP